MFEKEEENIFKDNLGLKIKRIRETKGYGVRELARKAQIEHHQLLKIEKGGSDFRITTLYKIARSLGVEPKDLLDF